MKSYNCEAVPQKLITSSIELGILSWYTVLIACSFVQFFNSSGELVKLETSLASFLSHVKYPSLYKKASTFVVNKSL